VTWIDIFPIVLVVAYGVGGFFSGLIRRFIGLVALFVAVWSASSMGIQAGGILQQTSSFEVADSRIYGFFGIIVAVLLIVEVATQLAHSQIQIPAVVLNRTLGTLLGLLTAILLSGPSSIACSRTCASRCTTPCSWSISSTRSTGRCSRCSSRFCLQIRRSFSVQGWSITKPNP